MRLIQRLLMAVVVAGAFAGGRTVSAADKAPPKPRKITDKTFVAWVQLANLSQSGGSVLTLENPRGVFDAVVFGELQRAKWMAGSNTFLRTGKTQNAYPAETAKPSTLVQIAVVYKGKQVTTYRNGQKYASYTMRPNPVTFTTNSLVLMGMRHVGAGGPCFFAGSIDDARIYDTALGAAAIASLKPNQASDPKPLGWWDFQDGKANDKMKTFPAGKLVGGAKIADGKLHLDGGNDLLAIGKVVPAARSASSGTPGRDMIANTRAFREKLLADPHRPGYHFVIAEGFGMPFDPNGAIYWKGRYHMFYIWQKGGHHWGHASSTDLFHWRHHPTGLYGGMFSGNAYLNKKGVPTMCYHDQSRRNNGMAIALDDELNAWKKQEVLITPKTVKGDAHHGKYRSWDPFGWIEDGEHYAIFGGKRPAIAKCKTIDGEWKYVGDLMAYAAKGVSINEDVSCADLFKIGDKRMLLCISHRLGARYYFGQWKNEQFHPTFHERMSWVDNEFFAPESLLDARGRRIMWAWLFDRRAGGTRSESGWSGTMSLPRVLTLCKDGKLLMNPPKEIEKLRYHPIEQTKLTVKADSELKLKGISGKSIELALEIVPGKGAAQFGVKVCCSADGSEQTLVYYDAADKKLKVDTTKSGPEGTRRIEAGPFELKGGETLKLRVFVDKSVVEVFANDGRQAVTRRIYPSADNAAGVALFSKGGPAAATSVKAWDIMSSNPY